MKQVPEKTIIYTATEIIERLFVLETHEETLVLLENPDQADVFINKQNEVLKLVSPRTAFCRNLTSDSFKKGLSEVLKRPGIQADFKQTDWFFRLMHVNEELVISMLYKKTLIPNLSNDHDLIKIARVCRRVAQIFLEKCPESVPKFSKEVFFEFLDIPNIPLSNLMESQQLTLDFFTCSDEVIKCFEYSQVAAAFLVKKKPAIAKFFNWSAFINLLQRFPDTAVFMLPGFADQCTEWEQVLELASVSQKDLLEFIKNSELYTLCNSTEDFLKLADLSPLIASEMFEAQKSYFTKFFTNEKDLIKLDRQCPAVVNDLLKYFEDYECVDKFKSLQEELHTKVQPNMRDLTNLQAYAFQKKIMPADLHFTEESQHEGYLYGQKVIVESLPKTPANENEINTILALQHDNLMTYLAYYPIPEKNTLYVVMPLLNNGNLKTWLEKNPDKASCIDMVAGIAKGLAYLHAHELVVCQFSPEFILLDNNNRPKITGYAFQSYNAENTLSKLSVWDDAFIEVRKNLTFEEKKLVNLKTFGRLLLFVFSGNYPQIIDGHYTLELTSDIPQKIKNLILKCLDADLSNCPDPMELVHQLEAMHKVPELSPGAGYNISLPRSIGSEVINRKPTDSERRMIKESWDKNPLENFEILDIQCIGSLLDRGFSNYCHKLQINTRITDYRCQWFNDKDAKKKYRGLDIFQDSAYRYRMEEFPDLTFTLAWHGTSPKAIPSIKKTGFDIREGNAFFKKGFYSTLDAKYAASNYATQQGDTIQVLVCLVVSYNHEIIMERHEGEAMNPRYDTGVVLVADKENNGIYEASNPLEQHTFTEIVSANGAGAYPFAVVTLGYNNLAKKIQSEKCMLSERDSTEALRDYLEIHPGVSSNLLYFADHIVSGHHDGRVKIWNRKTSACKYWPIHEEAIVALSCEGNFLIAKTAHNQVIQNELTLFGIHSAFIEPGMKHSQLLKYKAIKLASQMINTPPLKKQISPLSIHKKYLQTETVRMDKPRSGDVMDVTFQESKSTYFGNTVAIKTFVGEMNPRVLKKLELLNFTHPGFFAMRALSYTKHTVKRPRLELVIPWFQHGNLEGLLKRKSNAFSNAWKIDFITALVSAIHFLDKNEYLPNPFRLSCSNIMIKADGMPALGLSQELMIMGDSAVSEAVASSEENNEIVYRDSESLSVRDKSTLNVRQVIYTLGLIGQVIWLREMPYIEKSDQEIIRMVAFGQKSFPMKRFQRWENFEWAQKLFQLLNDCQAKNMVYRPTTSAMLNTLLEVKQLHDKNPEILPLRLQAPIRWVQSDKIVELLSNPGIEEAMQVQWMLAFNNKNKTDLLQQKAIINRILAANFRDYASAQEERMKIAPAAFALSFLKKTFLHASSRKNHRNYLNRIAEIAGAGEQIQGSIRPVPFWLTIKKSQLQNILHGDFPITNDIYGKGIYGSLNYDQEKSLKSDHVVIFCMAIAARPYPYIEGDPDFTGRRNVGNSDCLIAFSKKKLTLVIYNHQAILPLYILDLNHTAMALPLEDVSKKQWVDIESKIALDPSLPEELPRPAVIASSDMVVGEQKRLSSLRSPFAFFAQNTETDRLQINRHILSIGNDGHSLKALNCVSGEEIEIDTKKEIASLSALGDHRFNITYKDGSKKVWELTEYVPREIKSTNVVENSSYNLVA